MIYWKIVNRKRLKKKKERHRAAKRNFNAVRANASRRAGCAIARRIAPTLWMRQTVTVSRVDKDTTLACRYLPGKQPRRNQPESYGTNEQIAESQIASPCPITFLCLRTGRNWAFGSLTACEYVREIIASARINKEITLFGTVIFGNEVIITSSSVIREIDSNKITIWQKLNNVISRNAIIIIYSRSFIPFNTIYTYLNHWSAEFTVLLQNSLFAITQSLNDNFGVNFWRNWRFCISRLKIMYNLISFFFYIYIEAIRNLNSEIILYPFKICHCS